jgi:hypothetical protein
MKSKKKGTSEGRSDIEKKGTSEGRSDTIS